MNPDDIKLDDLSKVFEYFKLSSEIDAIDDVEKLRTIAKSYVKLYMKHQEVVLDLLNVKS